jgi:hypothetical protein
MISVQSSAETICADGKRGYFGNCVDDSSSTTRPTPSESSPRAKTDFPLGWSSVALDDLYGTFDYEYRKTDTRAQGLEVVGDIDGDGRVDKVRLMQKNDMSECAVIATLNKKDGFSHTKLLGTSGRCRLDGSSYFVTYLKQKVDIRTFQFAVGAYGKGYFRYYYELGNFVKIVESD